MNNGDYALKGLTNNQKDNLVAALIAIIQSILEEHDPVIHGSAGLTPLERFQVSLALAKDKYKAIPEIVEALDKIHAHILRAVDP